MEIKNGLTGYPSVDRPWIKYYKSQILEYPTGTMYEYLIACAQNYGRLPAMLYFGNAISYEWFFKEIDSIAEHLAGCGVKKGDIVMLITLNTPEAECLYYALNKIGAVSCNEYVTQSAKLLGETVATINPKLIFIQDIFVNSYGEALSNSKNKIIVLPTARMMRPLMKLLTSAKIRYDNDLLKYDQWIVNSQVIPAEINHDATLPAVMLSTSGTTGIPKKVVHCSAAINAVIYQYQQSNIEFYAGEKVISPAPIFLAFGVTLGMHLPLCTGICNINVINPDNQKVAAAFHKYKPAYFLGGIHMVRSIFKHRKANTKSLSFLKVFAVGGESFTEDENLHVNESLKSRDSGIPMITGYGMTELGATAVTEMNDVTRTGTVGIPQLGVNVKIINTDDGSELKYNQVGEVLLSGPSVFMEYYNNPEETQNTIETDTQGIKWVHTGDLGKVDEDGFLYIQWSSTI